MENMETKQNKLEQLERLGSQDTPEYVMDPTRIVEDTEQTWFCPQTYVPTDRQKNSQQQSLVHILWNVLQLTRPLFLNSLAPGKFEWNFRYVTFKWILAIDGCGIYLEVALIWMSLDFTDDQSTLVQVMA